MSDSLEVDADKVVEEALAAAKYRRERLEQLAVATTPASSAGSRGGKRKNLPKNEPMSVASTAITPSTSATEGGSEKVTPDPKHIRTNTVEPKVLFASPGEALAPDASMNPPSEGPVLIRGMSSLTTIPATEEELAEAQARMAMPEVPRLPSFGQGVAQLPDHVQKALTTLTANPVLMQNPECLNELINALVQPAVQTIPTPQPPPVSDKTLEARKTFWSKFKRPAPADPVDLERSPTPSLLTAPTLEFGEPPQDAPSTIPAEPPVPPSPASPVLAPVVSVAAASQEAANSDGVDSIRSRFMKMDTLELDGKIIEAISHPQWNAFSKEEGVKSKDFGSLDVVEELVHFHDWLSGFGTNPEHVPCTREVIEVVDSQQSANIGPSPDTNTPPPEAIVSGPRPETSVAPAEASVANTPPPEATVSGPRPETSVAPAEASVANTPPPEATVSGPRPETNTPSPEATVSGPRPETNTPPAEANVSGPRPEPASAPAPGVGVEGVPSKNDQVVSCLTRLQTVDLQNGQRPPQSLSSQGNPAIPVQTIVYVVANGNKIPTAVPLTPEQCEKAGLELVNPIHGESTGGESTSSGERDNGGVSSSTPTSTAAPVESPKAESEELSSKQMLKNMYMRFSRSYKRSDLPEEVADKFAKLKELEAKHGTHAAVVRRERQKLFEEFVQANENWADSSIVLNSRNTQSEKQRGVYKLFSKEDLLVKYHNNVALVDELIKGKEELGEYEQNPDVPTMRLFKCWDSSATINEDENSRSMNVASEGAVSASQAATFMRPSGSAPSTGGGDGSMPPPKGTPKGKGKGRGAGRGRSRSEGDGGGAGANSTVPKQKTAAQEAKTAMGSASSLILEGEGWNQKLIDANVPEQLRRAVVDDLGKVIANLKSARQDVEATVSRGADEESLRVSTQQLTKHIADYKHGAKAAKGLASGSKAKARNAAKP